MTLARAAFIGKHVSTPSLAPAVYHTLDVGAERMTLHPNSEKNAFQRG